MTSGLRHATSSSASEAAERLLAFFRAWTQHMQAGNPATCTGMIRVLSITRILAPAGHKQEITHHGFSVSAAEGRESPPPNFQ